MKDRAEILLELIRDMKVKAHLVYLQHVRGGEAKNAMIALSARETCDAILIEAEAALRVPQNAPLATELVQ